MFLSVATSRFSNHEGIPVYKMNPSLPVSNIVGGGRGILILVMSLVIVSKIACQRMFQLSDRSVPRTFVEDCNPRHACQLFQYLSRQFISSPPSPQFNVVYRDEVVIARFQHCRREGRGREEVPYSSDVISYCFQNSLSTHVPVI